MSKNIGLKFGFIGVGQCGGNIANELNKLNYKAIAINTANTDLAKLDSIQRHNKLLVNTGVQGAGKNPDIGRTALEEHIEGIMHLIGQVFDDVDMIFVCTGLGGGTGSGISPLLTRVLVEQGFDTGMIVTIPSNIESPKTQIVALNAFEEISQIEGLGSLFIVDNAKATKLPEAMGLKTKYGVINSNIANKLDKINQLTIEPSEIAFDARDFQTLLLTRGYSTISSISIDDISELKEVEFLGQSVKKALDDSIYADTDYQHAKGVAFLFELPDGGSHYITEKSIEKMQEELGTPFEIFTGVYENKKRKKDVVLHVVATGLPFPIERLTDIQKKLESKATNMQNLFEKSQKQVFKGSGKTLLDQFVSPKKEQLKKPKGSSTLDMLLKKKASK